MRILREGTALRVRIGSRLRHTIVETVTDQDNVTVRLGLNSNETLVTATRQSSTTTRGELFVESP